MGARGPPGPAGTNGAPGQRGPSVSSFLLQCLEVQAYLSQQNIAIPFAPFQLGFYGSPSSCVTSGWL